jgi:hypothetical protein
MKTRKLSQTAPALCVLAVSIFFSQSVVRAQKADTPPGLDTNAAKAAAASEPESAPTIDRVGFQKDYSTTFQVLRTFTRNEEPKIITVYANAAAASVTDTAQLPYPYGSVLVFEYASSLKDSAGNPMLDAQGGVRKGEVDHADVMRREKGFGEAYGKHRTGEWEYAGYRPDGSYTTPPAKSASCATCHVKAGSTKDFVFRGKF